MTDEKSAFLFIDNTFVENLDGVVQGVVPAKKVSHQPLIEKDRAWKEEWLIGGYVNVLYDEDEQHLQDVVRREPEIERSAWRKCGRTCLRRVAGRAPLNCTARGRATAKNPVGESIWQRSKRTGWSV